MSQPALAEQVEGRGRMYRHPVSGDLYPSVTACIGTVDKPALVGWAAKVTAGAAWDNRNALMAMDDRDAAIDLLKNSRFRSNDRSKNLGTSVHEIAEALAKDEPLPTFGEDEAPYADSFLRFVSDYDPRFEVVEGTVFNDTHRYSGTFDGLATIGGARILFDLKTSKSGIYPEVALQLAALRFADWLWDPITGDLNPMPQVDACIAVHLRPEKYAVHSIKAGERAFSAFLGARGLWDWCKGGDDHGVVGPPLSPERLAQAVSA